MLPLVLRSRRFRRLVLGKVMAFPEQAPLDWTVRFSRAWATAPAFDATRRAMEATLFSAWDRVQVPVTLAWGEHDTQIEPIPAPRSEIRSVTLPGCGHVPIWDNPDALIRTVLETTHDRRGREEATIAAD
jgi:pimeloyl-ACP methyl ester carboxylesterase